MSNRESKYYKLKDWLDPKKGLYCKICKKRFLTVFKWCDDCKEFSLVTYDEFKRWY